MISTNEFRTGQTIIWEKEIYLVIEFMHVKPGKGGAFVRTKLRNLRSGAVIDYTFPAGVTVEKANIEKSTMIFSYIDGQNYVFQNTETWEQVEIPSSRITAESPYLYEGLEVQINIFDNSEILGITLPDKVTLEVVDTIEGVKADNTKTNSLKDATTNTGLIVKVPMFVKNGDKIIVSTFDGSYFARDNK